jgi:hypothetical protein
MRQACPVSAKADSSPAYCADVSLVRLEPPWRRASLKPGALVELEPDGAVMLACYLGEAAVNQEHRERQDHSRYWDSPIKYRAPLSGDPSRNIGRAETDKVSECDERSLARVRRLLEGNFTRRLRARPAKNGKATSSLVAFLCTILSSLACRAVPCLALPCLVGIQRGSVCQLAASKANPQVGFSLCISASKDHRCADEPNIERPVVIAMILGQIARVAVYRRWLNILPSCRSSV